MCTYSTYVGTYYVRTFVSLIFLEPKKVGSGCGTFFIAALIFTAIVVLFLERDGERVDGLLPGWELGDGRGR